MRAVALITVRNEELYLRRSLEHLSSQGIETCLIDNGSTDNTIEIAQSFSGRGICRIENLPYCGYFDLPSILKNEEKLAREINADWFMHHDADEIREAPPPYESLLQGIEDADRQGYNAINFDEFVFLPTNDEEAFEGTDYANTMQYYYFFEPAPQRRINAWKKGAGPVNLSQSGGHRVDFQGRRIFPISFILRHYVALSRAHAIDKYTVQRVYPPGNRGSRATFTAEKLRLPAKERLKKISGRNFDKSDPWRKHEFLLGKS